MLNSTKVSMGFGLCKCRDCRKPRMHKRYLLRYLEYRKIRKHFRKKMDLRKDWSVYEDISFSTCKYTD